MIVMKKVSQSFFICLLFLATISCESQVLKLHGYYESVEQGYNSLGKDYFSFKGNSFQLVRVTDVEDEYGVGKYSIRNDSIELNFESVNKDSNTAIEAMNNGISDSVYIDVEVMDKKTHTAIPNAGVLMVGFQKGNTTNENGLARIRLHRDHILPNDTLRVFFIGYTHQFISLNVTSNNQFKIKVELTSGYHFFGDGDVLKYRIVQDKDAFLLFILNNRVSFKRTTKGNYYKALRAFKTLAQEAKKVD